MFIEMDTSIVIPFGYEHAATVLHQFQRGINEKDREDLVNVRIMPDFLLISQKKKNALLVEVKYRRVVTEFELKQIAQTVYNRWPSTWLFLATFEGFFFGKCTDIKDTGVIKPLPEIYVALERQREYHKLLENFISRN